VLYLAGKISCKIVIIYIIMQCVAVLHPLIAIKMRHTWVISFWPPVSEFVESRNAATAGATSACLCQDVSLCRNRSEGDGGKGGEVSLRALISPLKEHIKRG
jgi:hypothetical protein